MNTDIRNFGAVGQQTRLTAGQPVQTRLHQYGALGQKTQMPPQPPIQKKITQYKGENVAKKQKAQEGEWVREENDPVDSLDELKDENADDKYEDDDWDDEFRDLDIEQQDSEQQGEWSASAESEFSNLPDNGAATAEYASSSLDANNRPIVPDGWVDTTRADKSEVVRQAKIEAQDLGLVIEEGVYGLQLRSQRAFAKNQPIAPYRGVRMTGIEADSLPNTYDKIVPSSDGEHVVVGDVVNPRKPSIASYANDPVSIFICVHTTLTSPNTSLQNSSPFLF